MELFDKVYIDDIAMYELCRSKGHYKALPPGVPEIGDLVTGKAVGRENHDERIITFTEGIGLNDVAAGQKIYEIALANGIGTMLEL